MDNPRTTSYLFIASLTGFGTGTERFSVSYITRVLWSTAVTKTGCVEHRNPSRVEAEHPLFILEKLVLGGLHAVRLGILRASSVGCYRATTPSL